jgi:glutathione peroxidase
VNYRKIIIFILVTISSVGIIASLSGAFSKGEKSSITSTIYDFKIKALDGSIVDFSDFKGKKLLIVNTASKCGYTYQYEDLEKLHDQYGDKVSVLGFPANNFLWQEPGSNSEIAEFCQRNYGVTFQMFEKISVKGKDKHPLYKWLEAKTGETPSWNFCKYVVSEDGETIHFFSQKVKPLDAQIMDVILK